MIIDADRFWSHVRKGQGCWVWTGLLTDRGYGRCGKGGRRAHRVSFELQFGGIPRGKSVLHRCDNRPCVRPSHLFIGTQADNLKDMAIKGRWLGKHRPSLDRSKVRYARRLYASGHSFSSIARRLGSTHVTIARAVRGFGVHYAYT